MEEASETYKAYDGSEPAPEDLEERERQHKESMAIMHKLPKIPRAQFIEAVKRTYLSEYDRCLALLRYDNITEWSKETWVQYLKEVT